MISQSNTYDITDEKMLQCQSFPKKKRCFEETIKVEQNAINPALYIINALTITQ